MIFFRKYRTMKQFIIILAMVLWTGTVSAQEVVRSTVGVSGTTSEVKKGDQQLVVQQSVGQSSVIGFYTSGNQAIRQGFIQPPIEILSVGKTEAPPIDAVVYPNPFASEITVALNEELSQQLEITIYDMLGRVVFEQSKNPDREITIDLSFLSTAQYVLLLSSEEREFKANILKN